MIPIALRLEPNRSTAATVARSSTCRARARSGAPPPGRHRAPRRARHRATPWPAAAECPPCTTARRDRPPRARPRSANRPRSPARHLEPRLGSWVLVELAVGSLPTGIPRTRSSSSRSSTSWAQTRWPRCGGSNASSEDSDAQALQHLLANLSGSFDHELVGGELRSPIGPRACSSGSSCRYRRPSEHAAVGEACRGIDVDGRGVDADGGRLAERVEPVTIAWSGRAVAVHVSIAPSTESTTFTARMSAWYRSPSLLVRVRQRVGSSPASERVRPSTRSSTPTRAARGDAREEVGGDVGVYQERLGGVAGRRALDLRVHRDGDRVIRSALASTNTWPFRPRRRSRERWRAP